MCVLRRVAGAVAGYCLRSLKSSSICLACAVHSGEAPVCMTGKQNDCCRLGLVEPEMACQKGLHIFRVKIAQPCVPPARFAKVRPQ